MRLRAGSWPWLLAHEIRLAWRGFFSDNGDWRLILLLFFWILLHLPAYFVMRNLPAVGPEFVNLAIAGLVFWFAFTLMLSTAVTFAVNALYDRGDLDLLISSPLRTSTVFAVRGIGVAISSVAIFAGFASPFVHMGIVTGKWQLIAFYPVLAGTALAVAAGAFAMTLVLARWLGARRARVVGQVLSAFIGASLFMLFQIRNLVSDEVRASWTPTIMRALSSDWLGPESPLWLPVRAVFGDPLAVLATVGVGLALFLVVVRLTSTAFVSGTQESTTAPNRRAAKVATTRFHRGLVGIVMRKELRLIRRDPNLIARTLLQSLYLLPLLFVMARNREFMLVLAPGVILLLAGIAGSLAWITISAEEAPDLIGSAPVHREQIRWFKAAAALTPLVFGAAPFVLLYIVLAPTLAPAFALFLALALLGSAVTQVWGGKPAAKRDLKQRQKQNLGLNFVELISTAALAGACYLSFMLSWWALAVLPFGLLGPGLAWKMRQYDRV